MKRALILGTIVLALGTSCAYRPVTKVEARIPPRLIADAMPWAPKPDSIAQFTINKDSIELARMDSIKVETDRKAYHQAVREDLIYAGWVAVHILTLLIVLFK